MGRRSSAIIFVLTLWGLGGCANPWQQFYHSSPAFGSAKLSPAETVQVTSVEAERLNGWAVDARQRRLKSDVPLDKLTAQDRIDETNRLMTALRISERAPTVRVLGVSEFSYASLLRLDDPQLEAFAKRIGADYVVVAEQYGGQTNQTVMYPMTTFSNANATVNVTGSSGNSASGYGTSSETSTTLVPMQVQRNVFIHSAVFIRKMRPQDPPYK